MVICPRCGSENDTGSNFCHYCGTDLRGARSEGINDTQQESIPSRDEWNRPGMETPRVEPEKRRRSPRLVGCLTFIAVLLLLCVAFFVWGLTPTGQEQFRELGTWAAREATKQAGGN